MIHVSVISTNTLKRYREYLGMKIYPSRRAAFRAAKRDANIPMSKQPEAVIYPQTSKGQEYSLDDRNVRLYIFNLIIGVVAIEYHIREDKKAFYGDKDGRGNQPPHFNSGEPPNKLGNHHYWEND